MEKRSFERLPVNLEARLFYGNLIYTGVVTNISENGLFIRTKMSFPVDSVLMTVLMMNGSTVDLPIKVRRIAQLKNDDPCLISSGMGVGLLNPSQQYLDYVANCRASV